MAMDFEPSSSASAPQGTPEQYGGVHVPDPKTYFVWSVLSTFFCCQLTGLVAIVYGSLVSSRMTNGDYNGAVDASKKALLWTVAGPFLWAIFAVVVGIAQLADALLPHGH